MSAIALSPEQFIFAHDYELKTSSLKIAEAFDKNHKDVLRAIEKIISQVSASFQERNFALMTYDVEIGKGATRKQPMYEVTKDGFVMVVMSFTGEKAMVIKEAYINAFNFMADKLFPKRSGLVKLPEPQTITKAQQGELFAMVANKARSSGKPNAYFWSRFQNHFKLASYKDTPADKFDEAKAYLLSLEGDADLLHVTPLELDALVEQRVKKVLEGEWLSHAKPESPQTDENGVTLFFPKLKNNRQRRWLVQQPRDEMVMYWALDDDQEVMSWQDFRKKIAYEPTELQALLEQLPIDLLPGVMNTTVRRLMACVR